MAPRTRICAGVVLKACQRRANSATAHPITPTHDSHFLPWVSFDRTIFAPLTAPKTIKKPPLPMVEMLWRSPILTRTRLNREVIRRPSTGLFQTFFSRNAGSSPSFAMMKLRRAVPYNVALIAERVESTAAAAISLNPVVPRNGFAASARA